jgi:RNA polymerase sigma factor (sigma-70 family)
MLKMPGGALFQSTNATQNATLLHRCTTLVINKPIDNLDRYLEEIGRYPLLSKERELHLSRQVQQRLALLALTEGMEEGLEQGKEQRKELRPELLAKRAGISLQELQQTLKTGERAKDVLVRHNLRLVVSIAKKYRDQGLSLEDLIQEGNVGLMQAAERFDPEKGYRFSTYATWWIRRDVSQAVANQGRTIRVSVYMQKKMSQYRQTMRELSIQMGRRPTHREITAQLGLSDTNEELLVQHSRPLISLNELSGEHEDQERMERLVDPMATPFQSLEERDTKQLLWSSLGRLEPLEKKVITARFGLDHQGARSYGEIEKELELTTRQVRRLLSTALEKLQKGLLQNSSAGLSLFVMARSIVGAHPWHF